MKKLTSIIAGCAVLSCTPMGKEGHVYIGNPSSALGYDVELVMKFDGVNWTERKMIIGKLDNYHFSNEEEDESPYKLDWSGPRVYCMDRDPNKKWDFKEVRFDDEGEMPAVLATDERLNEIYVEMVNGSCPTETF